MTVISKLEGPDPLFTRPIFVASWANGSRERLVHRSMNPSEHHHAEQEEGLSVHWDLLRREDRVAAGPAILLLEHGEDGIADLELLDDGAEPASVSKGDDQRLEGISLTHSKSPSRKEPL